MIKNKINGKIYIGQTIRPIQMRLKEHRTGKNGCHAIYNAIQTYGWKNFDKDWYEVPDDDLNFYEEMLIALLGTLSPNGYNLKEGGGNGKLSEETKQKISESLSGEKNYRSKRVYQYDLEGNELGTFPSTGEAARYLKKKSGSIISRCARGKLKSAHGFKWSYINVTH